MILGDENKIYLVPLEKDIDILPGFEKKNLNISTKNPLLEKQSTVEAFETKADKILQITLKEAEEKESVSKRWKKFVSISKAIFQTHASDFGTSDLYVTFSKRVNDVLVEFEADNENHTILRNMQENETRLKEEIEERTKKLKNLYKQHLYDQMVELVQSTCMFLTNYESPNFYPAQFILVSEFVDVFSNLVNQDILNYTSIPNDFENSKELTREIVAIEWTQRITTTKNLLPKLLMEIGFLSSIEMNPFKNKQQQIELIAKAIGGLGCSITSIFVIDYLVKTVFFLDPKNNIKFMEPLLALYTQDLIHMQKSGFSKIFHPQLNFTFDMFLDTQEPALQFFLKTFVSLCDGQMLADSIDNFYKMGKPNGFIMKTLLDVLPTRFISLVYPVILKMIDESDDTIPHHVLLHHLIDVLADENTEISQENIIQITNDLWTRSRDLETDNFILVAVPLSRFVCRFCPPHHIDAFFLHLLEVIDTKYEKRNVENGHFLSDMTVKCVAEIIRNCIEKGSNFGVVLEYTSSIVDLMDYLDGKALDELSLFILDDIRNKPFELIDPLCIHVLLQQSIIAFQSISILSPFDVVEQIISKIEWFLYRVDFGENVEAHLNFLLQARESFQTSSRLSSVVTRIALRDCVLVYSKKLPRATVALYSLFAFSLATIPSINDPIERASLFLYGSNIALICTIVTFAHTFFEWFMKEALELPPEPRVHVILKHAFSILLIMPSKPEGDILEIFRELIKLCVRKKWAEDVRMQFAIDSVVLGSHMQRANYVLNVDDVDSNNILYRDSFGFQERIQRVMNQMATRLNQSIANNMSKKGLIKNIATIPIVALRAISCFVDCYVFDDGLKKELDFLIKSIPKHGTSIQQPDVVEDVTKLKQQTIIHLKKVYANQPEALEYVTKNFY